MLDEPPARDDPLVQLLMRQQEARWGGLWPGNAVGGLGRHAIASYLGCCRHPRYAACMQPAQSTAPASACPCRLMLDGVPVGAVRAQLEIDVPDAYLQSPLLEVRLLLCA